MKERFEIVYYIVFMILMTGGVGASIYDLTYLVNFNDSYLKYIGIGFLMTLARFIYNGQHFWNPPMEIPKDLLIQVILIFTVASTFIIYFIEDSIRYSF